MKFSLSLGPVSVAGRYTSRQPTGGVNRTPTLTACTDALTRTRVAQGRTAQDLHASVSQNDLSSTCHVSFRAAPDTVHQHKFSHTYLSNLTVVLSHTLKPVDARSIHTLRRFTAEWRILENPISHMRRMTDRAQGLVLQVKTGLTGVEQETEKAEELGGHHLSQS